MNPHRLVQTEAGEIEYLLVKKRIKNLNLRIRDDGSVHLSVPLVCTVSQADAFIASRCRWILAHRQNVVPCADLLPEENDKVCAQRLEQALGRVYPMVAPYGIQRPVLKIRSMRTQWGNCHWMQGYITLNRGLHRCPAYLREYVALHELIHFLHHDHGPGFYAVMDELMPDWKERRKNLKQYACVLRK